MKAAALFFLGALVRSGNALSQSLAIKPADFQPLTDLPWQDKSRSLRQVIERIFLEPNRDIRYPVLGQFFRRIPASDLPAAFEAAIRLESTPTPDDLVELLLFIWAKRDPATAWGRVQSLFDLVGLEDGWLGYDGWKERAAIEVQNQVAVEDAGFWLRRGTLTAFAEGVDESDLSPRGRVEFMKMFSDAWFERFDSWPAGRGSRSYRGAEDHAGSMLCSMFEYEPRFLKGSRPWSLGPDLRLIYEIGWRRWLERFPGEAADVLKSIESVQWPAEHFPRQRPAEKAAVSPELLLVWHRVDRAGLKAWASERPSGAHLRAQRTARCILMGEVEPDLRRKWLAEIVGADEAASGLEELAAWEPELAMRSAGDIRIANGIELQDLVDGCVYGPWNGAALNTSLFGIRYVASHGLAHVSESLRSRFSTEWGGTTFMEQWGSIDPASAARFGFKTLLENDYAPRADLIRFFTGEDVFADECGLIDRTFCALRVWAVTKPREMRSWIGQQPDSGMREALTWLLEHPWGGQQERGEIPD